MATQSITDPIRYATLIAGRIPNGAQITGLYEMADGQKWALVTLANGNEVSFCGGVMRRIDTRKVIRKGNRTYEVKVERHTSVPRTIISTEQGPDDSLVR